MKLKNSPHPYAFITSLCWSLAYALTRTASQWLSAPSISALRITIAAVVMLAILLITRPGLPEKKDIPWFILSGLSGTTIYMLTLSKGCATVTTATGNVMLAIPPIITAIAARILFREQLQRIQWCAIGICFVGVIVLAVLSGGFSCNIGLLWLAFAVLAMSTYNTVQRFLVGKYPPLAITAYSTLFGALGLLVFLPNGIHQAVQAPARVWLCLLGLGLLSSSLGYCLWTKAFSKAKNASTVTNYMFINPFISSFFGWILINDPVERSAIYGGALIILGLLLFTFGSKLPRTDNSST